MFINIQFNIIKKFPRIQIIIFKVNKMFGYNACLKTTYLKIKSFFHQKELFYKLKHFFIFIIKYFFIYSINFALNYFSKKTKPLNGSIMFKVHKSNQNQYL